MSNFQLPSPGMYSCHYPFIQYNSGMFEQISGRLQKIIRNFGKKGRLTPERVREGLKEVRRALIEADVNVEVAREFIKMVE
ncbi:signal recognition particle receptor subunit alpha, partial [candidate division WOR-3 bacterium]|nr:signal recognition particle receptor subunit alpha [candidate division WOR-3 bacterium]